MKVIKISALWCPACLIMNKIWNKVMSDYKDIEFTSLDYDMDMDEVLKYNPGKILPVVIFLSEDDNELTRIVGEEKEEYIRNEIDKYVK